MRVALPLNGGFMKYNLLAGLAFTLLAILSSILILSRNADTAINSDAEPATTSAARRAVLVELFTSEGCSSCPPADDLLIKLEKSQPVDDAEIIALSEHVDYWNRLGWTDPFSSSEFSERQSLYARVFRNDSIYTPQMVVDGHLEFVGSNSSKAHNAISKAAKNPKANIQIAQTQSKEASNKTAIQLNIHIQDLPAITSGDRAEILLAITEGGLQSSVSRGENAGRKIIHTAVVRKLDHIGTVDASKIAFDKLATAEIESGWSRDQLRVVVFVQERESRRVIGAAAIPVAAKP